MTQQSHDEIRADVVAIVAKQVGWSIEEASNVTGDISDMIAEGMNSRDIADATVDAIRASA